MIKDNKGFDLQDSDDVLQEINISEIGLEEAKNVYFSEERRTTSLESKSTSLFGLVTLVVTILIFILDNVSSYNISKELQIFNLFGIFLVILSLMCLVKVLWIKKIDVPYIYDPNLISSTCLKDDNDLREDLFDSYRLYTPDLYAVNEMKAKYFQIALTFLIIGFLISIITLIIFLVYK